MNDIIVKYIRTTPDEGLESKVPEYATEGSAGMDLSACISEDIIIKPGEIAMVKTGIAIQIPDSNIGGFVFPRSGISSRF
ncbi:MAG: dUTP diphosphatase, partial [Clostridiaceae bacterium]|nr:dUTP diphosphatase [Clostridiaceae bacterium]